MTTTKRRSERQQWNPDLGVLAARLQLSIDRELFEGLGEDWGGGLGARHGVVLAYLDEDGVRATELARLSGRPKQVVGRLIDELEQLGYVERRPDPADRRAKLIVPTERGLTQIRLADQIVARIERRHADQVGARRYAEFRNVMRTIVAEPTE
ncbi:MAG: MarR family transcriptional regulator [Solirubrobacterales bacterium]|nr:MarR family transcriptional regulator [Solirubrobacterales bacterium]